MARLKPLLTLLCGLLAACSSDSQGTPSSQADRAPPPSTVSSSVDTAASAPLPPLPAISPTPAPAGQPVAFAALDQSASDTPLDLPADLPPEETEGDPTPFPEEVTTYMVERDGCDHFRGEEAYDEDRRVFLEENIRELCSGTDGRLAALRRQYAANPDVVAALENYEDKIEADAEPQQVALQPTS